MCFHKTTNGPAGDERHTTNAWQSDDAGEFLDNMGRLRNHPLRAPKIFCLKILKKGVSLNIFSRTSKLFETVIWKDFMTLS